MQSLLLMQTLNIWCIIKWNAVRWWNVSRGAAVLEVAVVEYTGQILQEAGMPQLVQEVDFESKKGYSFS